MARATSAWSLRTSSTAWAPTHMSCSASLAPCAGARARDGLHNPSTAAAPHVALHDLCQTAAQHIAGEACCLLQPLRGLSTMSSCRVRGQLAVCVSRLGPGTRCHHGADVAQACCQTATTGVRGTSCLAAACRPRPWHVPHTPYQCNTNTIRWVRPIMLFNALGISTRVLCVECTGSTRSALRTWRRTCRSAACTCTRKRRPQSERHTCCRLTFRHNCPQLCRRVRTVDARQAAGLNGSTRAQW